jgi:hypothetical protein
MIVTEFQARKAQTNELPQVPWHAYTEPNLQAAMTSQTQQHVFHTVTSTVTISKNFYLTTGTQCQKQTLCLQHHFAVSSSCFWAAVSLVALKCYTSSHYIYLCTCVTARSHSHNLNNSTPVTLHGQTGELFVWFQLLHIISCNSASWNYYCIWQRVYVITENGNIIQMALDSAKILEFFRFCINSVPM